MNENIMNDILDEFGPAAARQAEAQYQAGCDDECIRLVNEHKYSGCPSAAMTLRAEPEARTAAARRRPPKFLMAIVYCVSIICGFVLAFHGPALAAVACAMAALVAVAGMLA